MVTAIFLDEARWAEVSEGRQQEWRLAIRELLDDHLFRLDQSPLVMRVSWDDKAVRLRWEALEEGVVADLSIDRTQLDPWMRDYVDICQKLSALDAKQTSLAELTALDQSKRDAHDLAAREIATALDAVGPTLDTTRRIFTLLVVLLVDTTRLAALQRPHGAEVIGRYGA